jgi:uncharacterized protein with gpF-like domain
MPIVDNKENSAVRTVRTMVTGAENRGRHDRYQEYESQGVIMKKVWIATPDGRTRHWHFTMDGQERDVDEPFIDGHGNDLMYPGDGSAPADTVYNCRCSMTSHIIGIRNSNGTINRIKDYSTTDLHEKQMKEEKERRER